MPASGSDGPYKGVWTGCQAGILWVMTLIELVLALLSLSVGGVVVAVIGWLVRKILRSYWWLVMRQAVAARVFALVPWKAGEALVYGMKRALLEVVVPAPVLHCRRVPAGIELVVPVVMMADLDDASERVVADRRGVRADLGRSAG
jgi:hypothetical protein